MDCYHVSFAALRAAAVYLNRVADGNDHRKVIKRRRHDLISG
jgi:hypothetical protein